ncbi:hypothetical protein LUQ84_001260 [Hamiltosporidium tvaerminnensis]|nr:hypothetical protein LUQ84_001260 [Hamiltosporidium tvaerminnensis]
MRCTVCKIETSGCLKEHYKSEFHQSNSQRKIHNIPPISYDEYIKSVEERAKEEKMREERIREEKVREDRIKEELYNTESQQNNNNELEEVDSMMEQNSNMYKEVEEINELQIDENNIHEEYSSDKNDPLLVTDGINLYLPNGKVLGNREYMKYYKQNYSVVDTKERRKYEPIRVVGKLSRYIFYNRKESLKKALQINMLKKLRPFILR